MVKPIPAGLVPVRLLTRMIRTYQSVFCAVCDATCADHSARKARLRRTRLNPPAGTPAPSVSTVGSGSAGTVSVTDGRGSLTGSSSAHPARHRKEFLVGGDAPRDLMAQCDGATVQAHAAPSLLVLQEQGHGACGAARVAWLEQESVLTVAHQLREGAGASGRHGQAGGDGFLGGNALELDRRGDAIDIGQPIHPRKALLR